MKETREMLKAVNNPRLELVDTSKVAEAISQAMANSPRESETIDGWIEWCLEAALEAGCAVQEQIDEQEGETEHQEFGPEALDAARTAFRICLPPLISRAMIRAHIACVAVGVARGYLSIKDANVLLYTTQSALAAWPKRGRGAAGRTK